LKANVFRKSVYGRPFWLRLACALGLCLLALPPALHAQGGDDAVVDAREAFRKKDRARLAADRAQALAALHPLAQWADYWELSNRLADAQQDELNSFYARWPGSYVEDRLRNDWLLELGKRAFA
jgi:soluble lytic murein transglycosylase